MIESNALPASIDNFEAISPPLQHGEIESRRERNPRITAAGFRNFLRLKNHPAAPVWNYEVGDRLTDVAYAAACRWQQQLPEWRNFSRSELRLRVAGTLLERASRTLDLARRLGGFSQPEFLVEHWESVETSSRGELSERLADSVPADVDFQDLIVFETSGTTGHSLQIPLSPLVQSRNMILLVEALERSGIQTAFGPDMTACLNVTARALAVTFPNVQSLWNDAGFARINLHKDFWRECEQMAEFIAGTGPLFLTGDPLAFREMQHLGIHPRVKALVSTGLDLPADWKREFQSLWNLQVLDWYSLTETGPIGCSCTAETGFHLVAPDLFVEIVDEQGQSVPVGTRGEIAVSGGRNPFLPLLRYRTGDFASLAVGPCACGQLTPRLVGIRGRKPLFFRRADGCVVNPVDVSRLLQGMSVVRFHGLQKQTGDFQLQIVPYPGGNPDEPRIRERLEKLFGPGIQIHLEHLEPDREPASGRATFAVE